MTTLIVGANGQLGRALRQEFPDAVALDRAALDVSDPAAVRDHRWADVDVVINAAGWTAVDAAEDPANLAAVRAVNVDAVGYLARAVADGRLRQMPMKRTHGGNVTEGSQRTGGDTGMATTEEQQAPGREAARDRDRPGTGAVTAAATVAYIPPTVEVLGTLRKLAGACGSPRMRGSF